MASFLQEDDGKWSAARLALLLWVVGVLLIWAIVSLRMKQLQPIPESVVTVIGILTTGKVVQKFGETRLARLPSASTQSQPTAPPAR